MAIAHFPTFWLISSSSIALGNSSILQEFSEILAILLPLHIIHHWPAICVAGYIVPAYASSFRKHVLRVYSLTKGVGCALHWCWYLAVICCHAFCCLWCGVVESLATFADPCFISAATSVYLGALLKAKVRYAGVVIACAVFTVIVLRAVRVS